MAEHLSDPMDGDLELEGDVDLASQDARSASEREPSASDDDVPEPHKHRGRAKQKAKAKAVASDGDVAGSRKRSGGYKAGPGRPTKSGNKGMRICQGCFKQFAAEAFPANSKYDRECAQAINNVYNAAMRQGQVEWYYEQTGTADGTKALLAEYFRLHPKVKGKRMPIKMLQLKEGVTVSTMVDRDDVGEMMHIDAFVHWARKPKNLGAGEEEAKILFKQLCQAKGAILDQDGPHKDRPTRVRVSTKKVITFRNRVSKEKGYDLLSKPNKKASQEDIDKAFHSSMRDHDGAGGMTNSGSMEDMAKVVCGAKEASDTWVGGVAVMPDIGYFQDALRDDPDEPGDEEEVNEEGDEPDDDNDDARSKISSATRGSKRIRSSDGGSITEPTPKKKAKGDAAERWWDRDAAVAAANKALMIKGDTFASALTELSKNAGRLKDDIAADDAIKRMVMNELAIMEARLTAVNLVLGMTNDKNATGEQHAAARRDLQAYIARVRSAQEARRSGGASSLGRARLGEAPPSKAFMDLITIEERSCHVGSVGHGGGVVPDKGFRDAHPNLR